MIEVLRVIISGGGTGGHIFPAIAIANAVKERYPDAEILFVGAEDRMEMTRIPAAGYNIVGLPVAGFNRTNLLQNVSVVRKLITSLFKAKKIIKDFKPDIVIGVGGYASGPVLKVATSKNIPTIIQEQNSYAGVTNKLLAKKVSKVCVAYEGMDKFFPKEKIVVTGNPCRQDLVATVSREEACKYFDLDPTKKIILILGGSLGARTINQSIVFGLGLLKGEPVQLLWQCGKNYLYENSITLQNKKEEAENIKLFDFIDRMDYAYKVADLVVSRAGASSISELSILAKPTILIPSPNVAEDHQTKNAEALVENNATVLITDSDAPEVLLEQAIKLVKDTAQLSILSANIAKMAKLNSADKIVDEIDKLVFVTKDKTV